MKKIVIFSLIFILSSFIFLGINSCLNSSSDSDSGSSGELYLYAPSNLVVTATSATSITMSWIDNTDGEIGFEVYCATPTLTYSLVITLPADTKVFTHTTQGAITPTANNTYYYRVRAYSYVTTSDYSNVAGTLTSWNATAIDVNTPISRNKHTAVWADNYGMIVWGGYAPGAYLTSGRIYSPTDGAGTWSTIAATTIDGRIDSSTIWTGSEMIVWGGHYYDTVSSTNIYLLNGGMYDPSVNLWTDTYVLTGTPVSRTGHSAIWTGQAMIIWGGYDGGYLKSGHYFDPGINFWFYTLPEGPTGRRWHSAVWTGTGGDKPWRHRMIVWGGYNGSYLNDGSWYDMETGIWFSLPSTNAPSARRGHTSVWTGSKMIVWGGYDGSAYLNNGGVYDPETNTWTPMSTNNAPGGRIDHTAVWTGSKMIIWGGGGAPGYNTGGVYDPETNTWGAISNVNVPSQRGQHAAVWDNINSMIIWGGWDGITFFNTGGIYKLE